MSDDISNTIEVLTKRVLAKEEEANKLKKLVNELCAEAGVTIRYPNIIEANGSIGTIRPDQYYGQPLTAAIRNYLEQRKASGLGAAALNEIYSAIRDGGYKFETKNEDIAQISVGNTLRKSSSIFHRLPNGQYGLLTWYPSAKAKPEDEPTAKKKIKKARTIVDKVTSKSEAPEVTPANDAPPATEGTVTNSEVRGVILEQKGPFQASTIEAAVKAKFPKKSIPGTKISTVIFILKAKNLIKEVSPRNGAKKAVYDKA